MATVSWGKPRIVVKKVGGSSYIVMPTPAEGSTSLETSQGDKMEAKIEGGEYEDVKYNANTYALSFQIRVTKGRTMPIEHNDGVVSDDYELWLQPEDPACPGIHIAKASVNAQTAYTSSEGLSVTYTFDALKKDATTPQLEHGVVTYTEEEAGTVTAATCGDSE